MGICYCGRKEEVLINGIRPIPLDTVDKIKKSIVKIKYFYNSTESSGTGFFMRYKSYNFIITNYHVIPVKIESIEIELTNKKIIGLSLRKRFIHKIKPPKDIMIIRIKPNEIEDIQYLDYDLNYERGYEQYLNNEVFSVGYPSSNLSAGSGKIIKINDYEFCHNIPPEQGSSGSPIILFNSLVIGIHKEADHF